MARTPKTPKTSATFPLKVGTFLSVPRSPTTPDSPQIYSPYPDGQSWGVHSQNEPNGQRMAAQPLVSVMGWLKTAAKPNKIIRLIGRIFIAVRSAQLNSSESVALWINDEKIDSDSFTCHVESGCTCN